MKRLLNSALSYLRGRPEAGTKRRTPARTRPRLRLEPLEDRSVPSATLVRDINETLGVGSVPDRMTAVGSRLYFLANDGANGRDLWTSDGTEAGTRLLRNFYPSGGATSFPSNLTPAGSQLFFTADDGTSGEELWVTDGTPAGTRLLDIRRGGSGSGPGT